MTREVLWSRDALDDVKHIADYIATDNPDAARRVSVAIRTTGYDLGAMPLGRPGRVAGTYEKVVRGLPYIIVYAIQPLPRGDEAIVVLRVIHGARNWPPDKWPG
jgi:toxin ParE1/3/4